MASTPVSPLRIQKGTSTSPSKGSSLPRPLSELAPTERRRNSPSFKQQPNQKLAFNRDSSPFQSSPYSPDQTTSPRLFWQGREAANRFTTNESFSGRDGSPSPTRRSSIERLQRASRVKNSSMFAREQKQEYDPASVPVVERPLARPLQNSTSSVSAPSPGFETTRVWGHKKSESMSSIPLYNSPPKQASSSPSKASPTHSPSKDASPFKSSLSSRNFRTYDPETCTWDEEPSSAERQLPPGRILHRHAKSVTFDAAPPQVNEYEMATPDLSSIGTESREGSYESDEDEEYDYYGRGDSQEREDSFDEALEDSSKTPVVGPDDWRASPAVSDGMGSTLEDPFDGPEMSPMPEVGPASPADRRNPSRNDSITSNGDHRPLPPLPGMFHNRNGSASSPSHPERPGSGQRSLPAPPAGGSPGRMTLEERLQSMKLGNDDGHKSLAEQQRERRMRRAGLRSGNTPERDVPTPTQATEDDEEKDTVGDLSGLGDYQLPSKISRESILRKLNGQSGYEEPEDYDFSSPMASSSPERRAPLDPDVPIPTTEKDIDEHEEIENNEEDTVVIKSEPNDDEVDLFSLPEWKPEENHSIDEYASESQYSDPTSPQLNQEQQTFNRGEERAESRTVSPGTNPLTSKELEKNNASNGSLPEFSGFMGDDDFKSSLQSYMTPPDSQENDSDGPKMAEAKDFLRRPETPEKQKTPAYDGSGWGSDEYESEGTPESVIHRPMVHSPTPPRDSPVVPDRVATVRSASGAKLKTRPSLTPADLTSMRDARRQVSTEIPVPPIPEKHRNRPLSVERELGDGLSVDDSVIDRQSSFKKKSLTLDIGDDLGLSLDKDFDRVIEAQKVAFAFSSSCYPFFPVAEQVSATRHYRMHPDELDANIASRKQRGYLMRQNTKVVIASSDVDQPIEDRGVRSAGNSPIKKDRPQSWTVEPWNGQRRKSSVRDSTISKRRPPPTNIPPMPGHESNAVGLGILTEEEPAAASDDRPSEDPGERGRLFVKVLGVKDLDLPLPKNERTYFSLTLDNGVHCVTTAWLELGRTAPIGQEFELVVPNELEFQLTLNAKLDKPTEQTVPMSPPKMKPQKTSTWGRVFASPKKRKELEQKMREEEKRIAEEEMNKARRMSHQATAWDLISPLAADDGSFARSYVCLKDHESRCYGRSYKVDIACFNEWATEEVAPSNSLKVKRAAPQTKRRAPYRIGQLELQLLFVPKPKGASDDDMPKSMNACIREMKEAEASKDTKWEGHLSQQGGDCPYWRRRFFKLDGNKLTAYHESTRQPRATINLSNASKLIDDKRVLTQKETTGKGGSRRKSGFAEEEEGYMFVEEGFRIRFKNGEVIDFYADSREDKEGWMVALDACVGKSNSTNKWCTMVLKREASIAKKATIAAQSHSYSNGYGHGQARPSAGFRHNRTRSMIV